jgi:hypothetical protein
MYFLVEYTIYSGEQEFSGHTIIGAANLAALKARTHRYFVSFYEEEIPTYDKKGGSYDYKHAGVMVGDIRAKQITVEEAHTLEKLRIAFIQ